jgi:Ran GTPase-activating protein (RanGAP) involved in mRNA processing and transport
MLSMVASVYELRQGVGMPATVAELYATASDAMLARGGVATPELKRLLQRIFFEAHVAQRRLIEDRQLDEAALGLEAPEALAKIRAEAAAMPFEPGGRAEMGDYVEVTKEGEHKGRRGVISTTENKICPPTNPYKVTFADGTVSDGLKRNELRSSGQGEMTVLQRAMDASAPAVRAACKARLSVALREALCTVRERVLVDALPVLSLWQSEPLQLQSSHLSFQEYFAAIALCDKGTELSGTPPWQWPAWWANAVKLGAEIPGDRFGRGLLRAAGVTGDTLDLSQKLGGGDRPTVRRVLAAVVASAGELRTLNLSQNELDAEDARALAPALTMTTLAHVDMRGNKIAGEGTTQLSTAVLGNLKIEMFNEIPLKEMRADSLTELDLNGKGVGVEGGMVVAGLIPVMGGLTKISLAKNELGEEGTKAICEALEQNKTLKELDISHEERGSNIGGSAGAKHVAKMLGVNGGLTSLNLSSNDIGGFRDMTPGRPTYTKMVCTPHGPKAIADALLVNSELTCIDVRFNNIVGDGAAHLSAAVLGKLNIEMFNMIPIKEMRANSFTELDLKGKNVGVEGGMIMAGLIPIMGALTALNLSYNCLKDEGVSAVCAAIQSNKETKLALLNFRDNDIGPFGDNDIGPVGANAVAAMVAVTGALTQVLAFWPPRLPFLFL